MQKEYKILQKSHEKLIAEKDELQVKFEQMKLEARESAQELMNLEGHALELEEEV